MSIEEAIEVFVRAVAFGRSFTHPCLAERVGPIWAMRDAPRKRGDYRKEEWIAYRTEPKEVHRIATEHTRGRYFVCPVVDLADDEAALRTGYKALGYRLMGSEAFFAHPMASLPSCSCPLRLERVLDQELADRLAKSAGSRQILTAHLSDPVPPLRQYVAISGRTPVGWVRSITVDSFAWCSNLHVETAFRRQGVGGALMARMLADDKAAGAKGNVLLASKVGAMLYPKLGYEEIGKVLIYAPPKG